jgi:hypothetical protein
MQATRSCIDSLLCNAINGRFAEQIEQGFDEPLRFPVSEVINDGLRKHRRRRAAKNRCLNMALVEFSGARV